MHSPGRRKAATEIMPAPWQVPDDGFPGAGRNGNPGGCGRKRCELAALRLGGSSGGVRKDELLRLVSDSEDGGLSDGMVIKSERIDGVLPRGLLMPTLGLAVGVGGDLGKGTYADEIWESNVKSLVECSQSKTHCSQNLRG